MSGTLINTGGGGWMQLAPGEYVPGVTPAPAPTTYDQWGRPVGSGAPAPAASGAGLGNLYNAVNNAATQQQMPANAPNLMGIGSSGYDQWGRQAPAQQGTGAAQTALNPMNQSIVDAIASGQPQQGAMLAQILGGSMTPPNLQNGGWASGGLLGAALGQGQGAGGGYQGGISGGSTGALGAGGPPGGSGNAAVDAAAAASEHAAAEEEQAMGGMY